MAPSVKMKAKKPSKVVKPKADKRRTVVSTKNHRFQSFNERIANLKIDPTRRRRNAADREELSEDTATYFGRALEEWKDLNLSTNFTAFAREVTPLCDNLPFVLHNREKIMDVLVKHVKQGDSLSLEPLLDLLAHFAHDLDICFEEYFPRAVVTVTELAATNSDPAVIEWSFTRLAWLFKYLSRVLVPDLRPLFDLILPYMGKDTQKPFVVRFAAESMSFLIRKAATTYDKDPTPLDMIITHAFETCSEDAGTESESLQNQGIMTMLTESMKGVQRELNSSGLAILRSVLKQARNQQQNGRMAYGRIMSGTLTGLIHHTDADAFQPVLEILFDFVNDCVETARMDMVGLASRLLSIVLTVRKGSRVTNWTSIMATLRQFLDFGHSHPELDVSIRQSILGVVAVTFQIAPIEAVLPNLYLLQMTRTITWSPHFLRFCDFFARLGRERFDQFLLPEFQKFILENWKDNVDDITYYLPKLSPAERKMKCHEDFQSALLDPLQNLEPYDKDGLSERLANANCVLYTLRNLITSSNFREHLCSILHSNMRLGLKIESGSPALDSYALGPCFATLLEFANDEEALNDLWPQLCAASSHVRRMPMFWSSLLHYINKYAPQQDFADTAHISSLQESILPALSDDSHEIRQAALGIAQCLYASQNQDVPEAIATAINIESTPIALDTARSISMNVRKLASVGTDAGADSFTQKAITSYCFGILRFQLSQAWEDSINSLSQLSKQSVCEEQIVSITKEWLNTSPSTSESCPLAPEATVIDSSSPRFQVESEFECPNMAKLSAICRQCFESSSGRHLSKQEQLDIDTGVQFRGTNNVREQALRVLNKMPNLAEKRSRMLVPVLLRWALSNDAEPTEDGQSDRWSRKDQKALLGIFAQFNNPKVLYRTADVYSALLNLCANGDVEIQRSALKTIFAWKDSSINTYEEHLLNLLDEARFRDQISVFLQTSEDDEGNIRTEHREGLMPVLLRLLYGRAVAGGKHGQGSRRKAIFVALAQYGLPALEIFVNVALGSVSELGLIRDNEVTQDSYSQVGTSARQQLGMVNMINDMLETLGSDLEPFAHKILDSVLVCTVAASRKVENAGDGEVRDLSLLRSIRQIGQQSIVKIFAAMSGSAFPIHARVILDELFVPRSQKFAAENTQSISAMLRLLSVFASSKQAGPYLSSHSDVVLERIAELLREPAAKDEVRIFVLNDILSKLAESGAVSILTQDHITNFVQSIGTVIKQQPSKDVIDTCITSLTNLASWIEDDQDGLEIIEVCAELLTKPAKTVSMSTKASILKTICPILDLFSAPDLPALHEALCGLFSRIYDLETRALLSQAFAKVCKSDDSLLKSAQICEDLNAQGAGLDEEDHERRERGFSQIFSEGESFTAQQWRPILHNCLFYLRDDDDLVNRTSATRGLSVFIDAARDREEIKSLITNTLLPGLEHGVGNGSELVRAEHLRLLGHVAESLPELPAVRDLTKLTVSGDDEASIFTNVLHIQQHRRLGALRRLADEASRLSSGNVTKVFIPLLEHFVFDRAEGDAGRTLADQAISTIGALGQALNWSSFRMVFKRYVGYLSSKPDHEPVIMRILSALVEGIAPKSSSSEEATTKQTLSSRSESIQRDLLPPLMDYIHLKDESTVDRRMPVAVTIVKLLLLLPQEEMTAKLAPVLTDVCHVLRSHSQEARDQTRKTLTAILTLVGPAYLGFMLKELRGALQRGSQLHVLSFTVHSMLVNTVESYKPGDLDHCLPQLASIIMDDIFGAAGQEKDSEDYRSKLKEVKSMKSFDTMELLARVTPMQRLGQLVQPLRALLSESVDTKTLRKADDILARLRNGVDQNPASQSRDALIFCHEIIRQVHNDQTHNRQNKKSTKTEHNRFIIQPEASKKPKKETTFVHSFKLVGFALNLLRKVLRRHEDLMTSANITGFLPIVGDALVQGQEEIQVAAMKLLSTIMKLDLPELEENAPVYVKESIRIIKSSSGLTGDAPKAALELLTSTLREKRTVKTSEKQIVEALRVLKRDIDEPDKQGIIYKFLRAILNRKLMSTEIYELMDEIGHVVVTNPDRSVRESARSAYIQFILEYPHGKDRWNKQASFFVQNLKYEHPSGRQSVMELLNQLLPKLPDDVVGQLAFTLFVALVPVQFSDADQSCRQMSGLLIAKLFQRVQSEQMDTFVTLLQKWTLPQNIVSIQGAAFQCWTVALRTASLRDSVTESLQDRIANLLSENEHDAFGGKLSVIDSALQTLEALVEISPKVAFAQESSTLWESLIYCLSVEAPETKEAGAKLIETYLAHFARSNAKDGHGLSSIPLQGSFGLQLHKKDMAQICNSSLQVLLSDDSVTEAIAAQTVRNIAFIGRCFAANGMSWSGSNATPIEDDELEDAPTQDHNTSAIAHLFKQLSYIVRQENLAVLSRTSAIQCQTALIKQVDEVPNLVAVVKPLYVLTDPSIAKPNDEAYKGLADLAQELLEAVQQKAGSESYLSALNAARTYAKSKREERRQKRKISAVSAPEKWAKAKKRKHDMQKAKHKANSATARGKRRGW